MGVTFSEVISAIMADGCWKLREILENILEECEEEYQILISHKIDHSSFMLLDKEALQEMGILIGPRLRILEYLSP